MIGITGTNGKSTCTSLIGEILQEGGNNTQVGGNLGTPFISLLGKGQADYRVLEISSFQMETIKALIFNFWVFDCCHFVFATFRG